IWLAGVRSYYAAAGLDPARAKACTDWRTEREMRADETNAAGLKEALKTEGGPAVAEAPPKAPSGDGAGKGPAPGGTTVGGGDYGVGSGYKLGGGFGGGLGGGYTYGGGGYGTGEQAHGSEKVLPCEWKPDDGYLQPVQGVYQDDKAPKATFDYAAGPQPNPLIEWVAPGSQRAHLPMIVGRDTVVMGVEKLFKQGRVMKGSSHNGILFMGYSDCRRTVAVKMRLKLYDSQGEHILYTTGVEGYAPIEGPPTGQGIQPFAVYVPTPDGLPPREVGAFRIAGPGPYRIVAELIRDRDDSPIGLELQVAGQAVVSRPPTVEFVPVSLSVVPGKQTALAFRAFVDDLATASHHFLPDYFPLPPDGLPTFTRDVLDLTWLNPRLDDPKDNQHDFNARITDRLGAAAVLSGAGRVVGALRDGGQGASDYLQAEDGDSAAATETTKVILLRVHRGPADSAGARADFEAAAPAPLAAPSPQPGGVDAEFGSSIVETVGHELSHSLPDHIWGGAYDDRHNMTRDCSINDHNTSLTLAAGERLNYGGIESHRQREDNTRSLMTAVSAPEAQWITQCAYAHLIAAFQHHVDPEVMLVRAIVWDRRGVRRAELRPAYVTMGETDLAEGPALDWAIVVRKAGGGQTVYPVAPPWVTEDTGPRDCVAVLARIPAPQGAGEIEIVYRGQVLARRPFGAEGPSLSVAPLPARAARGARVHVAWTASGTGPLLSSVYYSPNGGRWYRDQLFEDTGAQALDVELDPQAVQHVIKVVVTDGGRSREQLIAISTP
ncbi:MAG TPA: hypothetical protein VG939_05070, partial [Caulobacteraceae bacterium]|nr:hypothetical protein [Caulobacteraceae bacterium]